MNQPLTIVEIRVLGSLVEKQLSTPDYYPMTLNGLTSACNQKNNRDPVTSFNQTTVLRALDLLREKKLIGTVTGAGIRTPKYKHYVDEVHSLSRPQVTLICLLMLRGPQTVGELRGRSGPMHTFASVEEVESTLTALANRDSGLLVRKIPRLRGQKEARFAHLLSGTPDVKESDISPAQEPARLEVITENERLAALEEEVRSLKQTLEDLRKQFSGFRKQFE